MVTDNHYSEYHWRCPTGDGYVYHTLEMDIPQKEFENSMKRDVLRCSTVLNPAASNLIEPYDKYVQTVAHHISEKTEGLSDHDRALAALWFVQSAIHYSSDETLYGTDEFWAYPLETLYLHRGDCEDTAVLLCSIYSAMGIENVLLDYDNHEAVAVLVDGEYQFCDQTCSYPADFEGTDLSYMGQEPVIHHYGDSPHHIQLLNRCIAGYRNLIYKATGA